MAALLGSTTNPNSSKSLSTYRTNYSSNKSTLPAPHNPYTPQKPTLTLPPQLQNKIPSISSLWPWETSGKISTLRLRWRWMQEPRSLIKVLVHFAWFWKTWGVWYEILTNLLRKSCWWWTIELGIFCWRSSILKLKIEVPLAIWSWYD